MRNQENYKKWRKAYVIKNRKAIQAYDMWYYYRHRAAGLRQAKHWKDTHHEYAVWLNMLRRCNNTKERAYKNYHRECPVDAKVHRECFDVLDKAVMKGEI